MDLTKTLGSSATKLGNCPLLGLPRELRDIVYRYAVSYTGGLDVELSCNTTKSHVPHMRIHGRHNRYLVQTPANILKLVCKQTREETRGLIFKSNNEIALYGMSYVTPSSYSFGLFVSQFSSKIARDHLRRITVHGYPGVDSITLMPVAFKEIVGYAAGFSTFCEEHPHTNVVLQFRKVVDVEADTWFYYAGALQEFLRGASPAIVRETRHLFTAQLACISVAFANTFRLPDNLRFSILEIYPRNNIEYELEYYQKMGIYPAEQSVALSGATRKLFDDGI